MESVDHGSWTGDERVLWGVGERVGREKDSGMLGAAGVGLFGLLEPLAETGYVKQFKGFCLGITNLWHENILELVSDRVSKLHRAGLGGAQFSVVRLRC